jgi:hypothetical protein
MFLTTRKKRVMIFVAVSFAVIGTILLFLALIFGTLTSFHEDPKAQAMAEENQKNLEQEFRELPPSSQFVVTQKVSMHKTQHGIVSAYYKTRESFDSIKHYYQRELTTRGWRFSKEGDILYDGTDYGGKELLYCKKGCAARLQYAGRQETEFGWTFSFGMTWGLADECK